jgi:hypothetical protein
MSHVPEPPPALSGLGPALPGIPDRLLRSRWLASPGGRFSPVSTTISTKLIGISDAVE